MFKFASIIIYPSYKYIRKEIEENITVKLTSKDSSGSSLISTSWKSSSKQKGGLEQSPMKKILKIISELSQMERSIKYEKYKH